jgi:hypothetical protein
MFFLYPTLQVKLIFTVRLGTAIATGVTAPLPMGIAFTVAMVQLASTAARKYVVSKCRHFFIGMCFICG